MASTHVNQPVPTSGANAVASTLTAGIIFPSASRTNATYNSDELFNPCAKGVRLYIDITNVGGAGTLVVKIQTRDPLTDTWVDVKAATTSVATPFASVQTKTLTVYPGITVAAGDATTSTEISNFVSTNWRVVAIVGVNAVSFSVGAEYLL
jgi:predicted regulator of Ras-like GTPase activity (Roadblock/LC7/MglB family)